jgi:hypothetical protein
MQQGTLSKVMYPQPQKKNATFFKTEEYFTVESKK